MAPTSQQVDDRIEDGLHESSGSVDSSDANLPAVKRELRDFIEKKRQEEGMDPISGGRLWHHEPVQYELTAEEQHKITHRRERNREAARKSRERRRDEMERLRKHNQTMTSQMEELQKELLLLRQEYRSITTVLIQHSQQCSNLPLNPDFVRAYGK